MGFFIGGGAACSSGSGIFVKLAVKLGRANFGPCRHSARVVTSDIRAALASARGPATRAGLQREPAVIGRRELRYTPKRVGKANETHQ